MTDAAAPSSARPVPEAPADAWTEDAVALRGVGRTTPEGTAILADIDLTVARGGVLHLVGASGAGKSSLLRLIDRLDEPTAGTVTVLGREVRDWPVRALRRRVGLVFQTPNLLGLTVAENLALPFHLHGRPPADLDGRMTAALGLAGLDADLLPRREQALSVGQRQRVALARTLVTEPDVLLLDEPTASLDPRTAEGVLQQVGRINAQRGLTVLIATHRLSEMRALGGHIALLLGGRLEAAGPLEAVLADPPSEAAAAFLRGPNGEHRS